MNAEPILLTYERPEVMEPVVAALRALCGEGERVIWRNPFRWKDDSGVLSNCYESFGLESVCEEAGLEVVHDFHHAAIVRNRL